MPRKESAILPVHVHLVLLAQFSGLSATLCKAYCDAFLLTISELIF